jgi:hypothetical protein
MLRQVRQLIAPLVAVAALAGCTKDQPAEPPAVVEKKPDAQPFAASLAPQATYTSGLPGIAVASVVAREGFHVNPDYPVAFKPAAESTVKFGGDRVPLDDGRKTPCAAKTEDACQVDFDLPFVAGEAGSNQVRGVLAFSVCSADKCLIEKMPLTLAIDVR